jgi:hypothetical protein
MACSHTELSSLVKDSVADPECLSRIQDPNFSIPDPPKLSEIRSGLFIPDPDPDFLPIPNPGVKKAPDPGSATLVKASEARCTGHEQRVPGADEARCL